VRGLLHVHSRMSDGRGTLDEIAAAAARAGLQFLVVTDHGDGTRKPEPPSYRSGVLMIDAVEISTRDGHYLAIGLPQSPYPLGGAAADVVEDVRRLGGMGIAAHPDSPKNELRWADWIPRIDGFELINPDTSWRVKLRQPGWQVGWNVLTTLAAYPFRSPETIAREEAVRDNLAVRYRRRGLAEVAHHIDRHMVAIRIEWMKIDAVQRRRTGEFDIAFFRKLAGECFA